MEALMIKTFKPDKITAISADQRSGEFNYTSVKFAYDEGEMPPICIDGNLRLFRFRNKCGDIYSLSITCDATNEWFFRELCEVISRESCKLVRNYGGKKYQDKIPPDKIPPRTKPPRQNSPGQNPPGQNPSSVFYFIDSIIF